MKLALMPLHQFMQRALLRAGMSAQVRRGNLPNLNTALEFPRCKTGHMTGALERRATGLELCLLGERSGRPLRALPGAATVLTCMHMFRTVRACMMPRTVQGECRRKHGFKLVVIQCCHC